MSIFLHATCSTPRPPTWRRAGQIFLRTGPDVAGGKHQRRGGSAVFVDNDMPSGVPCKRIRQEFRSGRLADVNKHRIRRNGVSLAVVLNRNRLEAVAAFEADDA